MLKGVHQKLETSDVPAFFAQGPSPFSKMMFFCAVSMVLMAIDSRFDYLSQIRQTFIAALHPLEVIANAPAQMTMNASEYLTSHTNLVKENQSLKQEALTHEVKLQKYHALMAENAHLRSLLKGNAPIIPNAILAEISHMGRDVFSDVIVINRGKTHDVVAGQAVVDGNGVIGQVTRVLPYTAEVTLITDKKISVPIQIERNQLRAIAFGEGKNNTLDIPYLPTSVDIRVGDRLITSGIDGVYPAGLAVAEVTSVKQNPNSPFAKIISKPLAGVKSHLQLLILALPEPIAPVEESNQDATEATDADTTTADQTSGDNHAGR